MRFNFIKIVKSVSFGVFLAIFFLNGFLYAQANSGQYALLIAGLGGTAEHTEKFHQYLYETRKTLIERFQFPEDNIYVLAGSQSEKSDFIDEISTAENIKAKFLDLAKTLTKNDDIYILLFGHGSFDGKSTMLNIPRRDLKDEDYAILVKSLSARKIIFINTSSCSGPFIEKLSAPNRIIITATKSGTERNETIFPKFLVEAISGNASDQDKNGNLSVFETFLYAAERTANWYKQNNHLATEHPLLEDTGDKVAYRAEELAENAEGGLASVTYLLNRSRAAALGSASSGDTTYLKLLSDLDKVNREINLLKAEKSKYSEQDYLSKLEPLIIRLARINAEIEAYEQNQK